MIERKESDFVKYTAIAAEPERSGCEISFMPAAPALAMAYVPMQHFHNVYELDEAMQYGTIFPELNKPFLGWKGRCRR